MGTTGASMLLIRPLIRANDDRRHKIHVFVFFIFLVSNIGGALTPLGDPPLFLGFLKGVDFFWTTRTCSARCWSASSSCSWCSTRWTATGIARKAICKRDPTPETPVRIEGGINIILLAAVVGVVLVSGTWKPGVHFTVFHVTLELQHVLRDLALIAICAPVAQAHARQAAQPTTFQLGADAEVAKLFAGIFITIAPAIAMLEGWHATARSRRWSPWSPDRTANPTTSGTSG